MYKILLIVLMAMITACGSVTDRLERDNEEENIEGMSDSNIQDTIRFLYPTAYAKAKSCYPCEGGSYTVMGDNECYLSFGNYPFEKGQEEAEKQLDIVFLNEDTSDSDKNHLLEIIRCQFHSESCFDIFQCGNSYPDQINNDCPFDKDLPECEWSCEKNFEDKYDCNFSIKGGDNGI